MRSSSTKAGIPTVIADFRQYPLENTVPSMLLLGRILRRGERAQQVVDFYLRQVNEVYARLSRIADPSPLAFLYRAPGVLECCGTFGRSKLGSDLLPGSSGTLNPEQVLVSDPEVIVATGANWTSTAQCGTFVSLGYAAAPDQARAQLQQVIDRPGWGGLRAVKNARGHAIWHQFYNSPYHFVALQQIAKWMYPTEFADLDPDAACSEFHRQFLPIAYSGTFWVSPALDAARLTVAARHTYARVTRHKGVIVTGLALGLVASLIVGLGPARLGPWDAVEAILFPGAVDVARSAIVWGIRLPIALMAVVVGASLALAPHWLSS